jgi:predicted secreted protein
MGKVRGEDVILYLQDTTYKCNHPIGCARSVTFDVQQDLVETSVTGNGRFRTYVPGAASWSASAEGIVAISSLSPVTITVPLSWVDMPPRAFVLDAIDLCIKVGGSLIILGTDNADGTYTVTNYSLYNAGTQTIIYVGEVIPTFTPVTADITYEEQDGYGMNNLYDAIIDGTPILIEFYETDTDGHFLKKQGTGYIESLNEVASFDNMATFTANFKGNGLLDVFYG